MTAGQSDAPFPNDAERAWLAEKDAINRDADKHFDAISGYLEKQMGYHHWPLK